MAFILHALGGIEQKRIGNVPKEIDGEDTYLYICFT
jgi:hypothetical protein